MIRTLRLEVCDAGKQQELKLYVFKTISVHEERHLAAAFATAKIVTDDMTRQVSADSRA